MLHTLLRHAAAAVEAWRPAGLCTACRQWSATPVCAPCTARFAPAIARCGRCARAVPPGVAVCGACLRAPPTSDAALAAVSYGYPWAGLVAQLKFGGDPAAARPLAALLAAAPGVADAVRAADVVLPMPLATARLRDRGYNQALVLARLMVRATGGRACNSELLLRTRDTPPQTRLDRSGRLANVRGAFAVAPLQAHALANRRVVLVDDVMTSGASLDEAVGVLREAGAAHVTTIAAARTEPA